MDELREMAKALLIAKAEADDRYLEFVITVSMRTGLDANAVEQKIVEMAEGGDCEKVS